MPLGWVSSKASSWRVRAAGLGQALPTCEQALGETCAQRMEAGVEFRESLALPLWGCWSTQPVGGGEASQPEGNKHIHPGETEAYRREKVTELQI